MGEAILVCEDGAVTETATGDVASGEIVRLADGRAGVKLGLQAAVSGDVVEYGVEGIYKITSASATTFSKGDPVFWDASANAAVPASAALDGSADFYLGLALAAKTSGQTTVTVDLNVRPQLRPFVVEFDTETDSATHTLIPAWMNPTGLVLELAYGIVTEVFGGAGEDQGIVTISDTEAVPNALCTLTPTNGGADAAGDVVIGTAKILGGTTGDAVKTVAAGKGVTGAVTQAVSGAGAAGKMKVFLKVTPLA